MLRFLRIRRLAVIDAVEVEFDPGLNVLTGETGAGKSILVEAVGLLLGGRASGDLVRTGEESAVIEALFEHSGEELLVRREITAQGRSRAFVNGELTTAGALRELSSRLIELHGQHEHQTLLDPDTHLPLLDQFGAHARLLVDAADAFRRWKDAADTLAQATRSFADRESRLDLLRYQLGELDRAQLREGEDEELAGTRQVLASAERIERLCAESYAELYEQDQAVLASLGHVWRRVGELASIDPQFQPYLEAREGIKSQLEDLAVFLRRYSESIDASPGRLQQVEDRLALLERLKRKYGPTLADAIARRESFRTEMAGLDEGDARLDLLRKNAAAVRERYMECATALTGARKEAAADLARRLEVGVGELALPATRVDVRFAAAVPESLWSESGTDQAEFFISTNPGEDLRPLARIVSGGELSRIMLALKTVISSARHPLADDPARHPSAESPGLIFDEVDAGIGGRVADVVGRKLRALGSASQVLCITHLPQIASYADTHFLIEKAVDGGRTRTTVTRLSDGARVDEIGRMLGGDELTAGIRASAREMLSVRRSNGEAKGETKPKGESESGEEVPDRNLRLSDERARLGADGGPARTGRLRSRDRRR